MKDAAHCYFRKELSNSYFGKVLLINFVSTWKNLLKHCIFAHLLLMVSYVQGTLRKELLIVIFVESFKKTVSEKLH